MPKLLALDLDGTVLNSGHSISQQLIKTIQTISQTAHVVIVTGRHHVAARPYYDQLQLNTPIICCNGTYVFDYAANRVLSENAIGKSDGEEFIRLSEVHDLKMVMYVRDAMLYSRKRPIAYMEALLSWSQTFPEGSRPNIRKVDSFHQELLDTEYVWKFVVEGGDIDHFSAIPFVREKFNGERSWTDRVDFSDAGNNKGDALIRYAQQLGICMSESAAVGDNHNDISMLKAAGLGIAMQNADQVVKNSANLVTEKTNDDESGLSDLLRHLFL